MTRNKNAQPTRTIQLWPSGRSIEYRGDPRGPRAARSLRAGHYEARLRCSAYCRRYDSQMIDDETRAAYVTSIHTQGKSITHHDPRFARIGSYLIAEGDDWTTNDVCPACNGEGYVNNPKPNPWVKGAPEEWRAIRTALRAEGYQHSMILASMSSLVDDMIREDHEGFQADDLRNIFRDTSDMDADACREYINDNISADELPDPPACPTCDGEKPEGETCATCAGTGVDPDADDDDGYLEQLRDAVREHTSESPAEPMEWYLVDRWLCEQLHAAGEVTIDNNYGYFWGRCGTGQNLIMDGILQQIAGQYEREEDDDRAKIAKVRAVVAGKADA